MGERSVADLKGERLRWIVVEATIWGMPAVSMAALRRSLPRDLDAGFGDVIYLSDVLRPRHEFLTANHETPYVITFFDLAAGPMVLDVPAASATAMLFGSAIDSWEVPVVDVGATGEDAGKGGRYLFLPPGHEETPPSGFIVVTPSTRTFTSPCGRSHAATARSPIPSPTASSCAPTRSATPNTRDRTGTSTRPTPRGRRCQRSISTTCAYWPR